MSDNICTNPECDMELKEYDDYGAIYLVCVKCGWDERDFFLLLDIKRCLIYE